MCDPRWTKLSEDRRQSLLEKNREINVHDNWWGHLEKDLVEDLSDIGFEVNANWRSNEVYFSGFWSQGDGASFAGYVRDWALFLPAINHERFVRSAGVDEWTCRIVCSPRFYSHSGCMQVDFRTNEICNPHHYDDDPVRYALWDVQHPALEPDEETNLVDAIQTFLRGKANDYYRRLEEEYDHLTDDEQVVDALLSLLSDDELADPDAEDEVDADDVHCAAI